MSNLQQRKQLRRAGVLMLCSILMIFGTEYHKYGKIRLNEQNIIFSILFVLLFLLGMIQYFHKKPLLNPKKYGRNLAIAYLLGIGMLIPFIIINNSIVNWIILAIAIFVFTIIVYKNTKFPREK